MKNIILAFLFLFSLPALAIDKPIPCDGANCKLKFETRDGSNAKVSAGEASGATWTLGTTDSKIVLGGYSIASAMIAVAANCTSTPCTVDSDRGDMISTVTRNSTGNYTVNFTSSYWTAGPTCVVVNTSGSADVNCRLNTSALSATSYGVICSLDNGGTATDSRFAIICHGPR